MSLLQGVDPIAVADIQGIIKKLKELNIGILITDHNVRETLAICDRAYVIKDGEHLTSGTATDVEMMKMSESTILEDFKF